MSNKQRWEVRKIGLWLMLFDNRVGQSCTDVDQIAADLNELETFRELRGRGISIIAAEVARNGGRWTAQHDDEHTDGELADAAACYAATTIRRNRFIGWVWPFDFGWWKPSPKNRIRELARAGALIVAEIERLQRATVKDE